MQKKKKKFRKVKYSTNLRARNINTRVTRIIFCVVAFEARIIRFTTTPLFPLHSHSEHSSAEYLHIRESPQDHSDFTWINFYHRCSAHNAAFVLSRIEVI